MRKLMVATSLAVFSVVSLTGCGSDATTSATPSASPNMDEVKSLVRTLFYDESQAFLRSAKEGRQFQLDHNYPGSVDVAMFKKCAADPKYTPKGYRVNIVPDVSTIAPDPLWVGPPAGMSKDWTFAGKKPEGDTYIVTTSETFSATGKSPATVSAQIHVTIKDGKAYEYTPACQ